MKRVYHEPREFLIGAYHHDVHGLLPLCPKPLEEFDEFWNGVSIFHDVFEHYFEGRTYFDGTAKCNYAGEICAMGHLIYYKEVLQTRPGVDGTFLDRRQIMKPFVNPLTDSLREGENLFGDTLECRVPQVRGVESALIDWITQESYSRIRQTICKTLRRPYYTRYRKLKESITPFKIKRLLRYGYRNAKVLVPDSLENRLVLSEFISWWNRFTRITSAEDLELYYRSVSFRLSKKQKKLTWTATFNARYPYKDKKVSAITNPLWFEKHVNNT